MSALKDRIAEAMRRNPGLTQADIARACGVKTPSVSGWLSGRTKSLKPEPARLGAKLFGCDQNWLSTGVGAANWIRPAGQPPKGAPSSEPPQTRGAMDQLLSQVVPIIDPISVRWESIVSMELPPLFKLALADDALAPDYPAGTLFVWSTTKRPRIGSIVLVVDSFNQPHARRHAQGRAPGQWVAEATGAGFLPFDGAEVTLLAVAEEERRQMP